MNQNEHAEFYLFTSVYYKVGISDDILKFLMQRKPEDSDNRTERYSQQPKYSLAEAIG